MSRGKCSIFCLSKLILFFAALSSSVLCLTSNTNDCFGWEDQNSQIWSVDNPSSNVIQSIKNLSEGGLVDILKASRAKIEFRVLFDHLRGIRSTLERNEAVIRVVVDDVHERTKVFLNKIKINSRNKNITNSYLEFDEIESYLDSIASTHKDIVTKTSIGKSIEGRDIWMLAIKSKTEAATKSIFIEGGIHAREWIAPSVCLYLIDQLTSDSSILEDVEVRIVPMANPDGYVYSHTTDRFWRKNRRINDHKYCVGVDLNRNWDYMFGGSGSSSLPCSSVYKGTSGFSEPETKALSDAMLNTPNVVLVLTIHSYHQLMLYPWGYSNIHFREQVALKQLGNDFADAVKGVHGKSYAVESAAQLYPASGITEDWAYGVLGAKYAYTVELRDEGQFGFELPEEQIEPTGQEIWAGFLVLLNKVKEE